MRVGIYARVSTSDQHPEAQTHRLHEYAEARGLNVIREFVDHGISGTKARRPALDEPMRAARCREIDAVLVVKLDRIARSVAHLTALGQELEALGVDLIVLEQSIDTPTPAGRLLFHVLGSIAEFERDLIVERTRAGLAAAQRRGVKLGRSKATDRDMEERIVRLKRVGGRTVREIVEMGGVSKSTVAKVLKEARATRATEAA